MDLDPGKTKTLVLRATLKNGTVVSATPESCSSSNDQVAIGTINGDDVVIGPVAPGSARITVVADGLQTFVNVTVLDPDAEKPVALALFDANPDGSASTTEEDDGSEPVPVPTAT